MAELDDEDALRWAGEDLGERAAERPRRAARPHPKVSHDHPVESSIEVDTVLDFDEDDEARVTSSTALVTIGVLAGIYFLYSLGWLTNAFRSMTHSSDPVAGFMFNLGLWLAALAPALWFTVSYWLIERSSVRYAVLVLGALVLIPIPLVWPR
ncbi:MAG: hypothetical protein ACKOXM_06665 [Agromyces sp.]